MKKVCVFGASITSGYIDDKEGGWCDLLKRHFLKQQIFIFNLGISGDDTSDLLARMDIESKARKPDGIILCIGGNDSQFFLDKKAHRVPPQQFRDNFEKIIEIAKKYTDRIILVGLTIVDEDKVNAEYIPKKGKALKNEYLHQYDDMIKKIAKKHSFKFVPMIDVVQENDLVDGLHPAAKGHRMMFERIQKHISQEDFI